MERPIEPLFLLSGFANFLEAFLYSYADESFLFNHDYIPAKYSRYQQVYIHMTWVGKVAEINFTGFGEWCLRFYCTRRVLSPNHACIVKGKWLDMETFFEVKKCFTKGGLKEKHEALQRVFDDEGDETEIIPESQYERLEDLDRDGLCDLVQLLRKKRPPEIYFRGEPFTIQVKKFLETELGFRTMLQTIAFILLFLSMSVRLFP